MPQGDQTGPEGRGKMTGRGLGFCTGYDSPGYDKETPMRGRGFGRGFRGRRMGRGFRGRIQVPVQSYPAKIVPKKEVLKEELEILNQEKQAIEQDLKDVEKRLEELKQ